MAEIVVDWLTAFRARGFPDGLICTILGRELQEDVIGTNGSLPSEFRAYHEAGHAVLMLTLFGHASEHVSIEQGGSAGSKGGAKVPDGFFANGRDLNRDDDRAVIGWGGVEAVRLFWQKAGRGPNGSAAGFESDCRQLIHLASAHQDDNDFLLRTQARTEVLLLESWPAVEAVAGALIQRRELDSDALRRICEEAGAAPGRLRRT